MRMTIRLAPVLAVVAFWLGGPPVARAGNTPPANHSDNDPIEGVNRAIFWFNDQVDTYVLVPAASGWDAIAPARVKQSISNFFQNLRFPVVAANNLLQGKVVPAASDIGRFAVNTTVGVLGFFDPAGDWGLEQHYEDFGQTLGYWGVPPGPYLVLPFLGPSNPRDTVGFTADGFSTVYPFFVGLVYTASARAVDIVNARARVLKDVEQARAASLDYYTGVRNAYAQRRDALVHDRPGMSEQQEEDLYKFDTDGGEQP